MKYKLRLFIVSLICSQLGFQQVLAGELLLKGQVSQFDPIQSFAIDPLTVTSTLSDRRESVSATGKPRLSEFSAFAGTSHLLGNAAYTTLGAYAFANNSGIATSSSSAQISDYNVSFNSSSQLMDLINPATNKIDLMMNVAVGWLSQGDDNDNSSAGFTISSNIAGQLNQVSGTTKVTGANLTENGMIATFPGNRTDMDLSLGYDFTTSTSYGLVFAGLSNVIPFQVPVVLDPFVSGGLDVLLNFNVNATARSSGLYDQFVFGDPDAGLLPSAASRIELVFDFAAPDLFTHNDSSLESLGVTFLTDPIVVSSVSEPESLSLLLAPLLILGLNRWKRRKPGSTSG